MSRVGADVNVMKERGVHLKLCEDMVSLINVLQTPLVDLVVSHLGIDQTLPCLVARSSQRLNIFLFIH